MCEVPKLKFAHDELEPYMSEETVKVHYGKHTKGYFDKTNELIKGTRFAKVESLDELLPKLDKGTVLYNQAMQAWNHQFWWEQLCSPKKDFRGALDAFTEQVLSQFDAWGAFEEEFNEEAMKQFGSGWAWLVWKSNKLEIITTSNADRPSGQLLLVVDLWEHSYYLTYKNDREKYLRAIWNIIDWDVVNGRFTAGRTGSDSEGKEERKKA